MQLVDDGAVLSLWCTFVVWLGVWIRMKAHEGATTRRALPPLEGSICYNEPSARLADGAAIRVDRALTVTLTSMTSMTVMRRAPPAAIRVDPAGGGTRVTSMTVQLRGAPPAAIRVEAAGGDTRAAIRVDRALAAQSPVPLRSVSAALAGSSSLLAGSPSRPRDSRVTRTRGGGEPEGDGVSRAALHSSVPDRRLLSSPALSSTRVRKAQGSADSTPAADCVMTNDEPPQSPRLARMFCATSPWRNGRSHHSRWLA